MTYNSWYAIKPTQPNLTKPAFSLEDYFPLIIFLIIYLFLWQVVLLI